MTRSPRNAVGLALAAGRLEEISKNPSFLTATLSS